MWWPKMGVAGQDGSGYTAVPPTVVDHDGSDENRYAYHQSSINPPGHLYNQAAQWNYQYEQTMANGVAVPQTVYNGQEGWAYYGNDGQYWSQYGVGQPMNQIPIRRDTIQYIAQHHTQSTDQMYAQHELHKALADKINAAQSPTSLSGRSGKWQHRTALMDPVITESHPRHKLTLWKWRLMFIVCNILSLLNGYDLSNTANIQGPVYKAFNDIHLLPWVALSYSICTIVATPLARKLCKFYDIKILTLSGLVLITAGTALAGAAPNFVLFIIGRAIMAFGASVVYQGILSFTVIFSYPNEVALVQASIGASFSFGVLTGPVIGAGFAQNEHATWRWAFYFALLIVAIAFLLSVFALPSYSASTEKSVSRHFKEIDWIGHVLHSATFVSLSLATVFSGSAWPWGSTPQLVVWVIFVVAAVAYIVQQTFSIGVKPEHRIIPIYLFNKRIVLLTFLCTLGAGIAYGITLYYTPLFYNFTREIQPLEAGLRLLCLTALFIVAIFASHGLLGYARYYMPFFVLGSALLLVGGITHHTITDHTRLGAVMGFSAIIGAGVGILWNLAIPVCSTVLETEEERLDQATLHSLAQLGGTAVALSISASIYWNIGLKLVKGTAGFVGFKDIEILALLSGAESTMLNGFDTDIKELVIHAIVETIGWIYYTVIVGAAIALIASLFLRWEPLAKDTEHNTHDSEKGNGVLYEPRPDKQAP